jgi:2-polyprenyl-3-methyl-5-hydroxy-6-metoxy-1,4-benzoquinol methylase
MLERPRYRYHEDVNHGLLRIWGKRSGLRVLDVGCGFATTSARIQSFGNEVTGIDESPRIAAVAEGRLDRIVQADLGDFAAVTGQLGDQRFDVLIFADVLEHLPWPVVVLRWYLRWLKEEGTVIVSLPNVGLWSVRMAHLLGRWEYAETGVLDHTHLRFFTRRSGRRLIAEAGLEPIATTYNPGLVRPLVPFAKAMFASDDGDPAALMHSPAYRFYLRAVHPVERVVASLWPAMLAFQMIFEAKRTS